jgi:hypothetical protein
MTKNGQNFPWISVLILISILGAFAVGILGCSPDRSSQVPWGTPAGDPGTAGLTAKISGPDQVEACQGVPLEFSVTNQGDAGIYLLTWYTPLEGIAGRIFQVSYGGQELDYLGVLAMRGDPTPDQYIFLEAGESASVEVDLSQAFDFSRPGVYEIAFLSPWISYAGEGKDDLPESVDELGPVKIPSQPISLEVLPAEDGAECGGVSMEGDLPQSDAPQLVVTGRVREVSPSLKMIWLDEGEGFNSIALTEETSLVREGGEVLELLDIQPGMEVQASGRPGAEGVVIADEVVIIQR